jgi:hypothetical protein
LALTSPKSGGRSVGIVRSRTKATEIRNVSEHTTSSVLNMEPAGSSETLMPISEFTATLTFKTRENFKYRKMTGDR